MKKILTFLVMLLCGVSVLMAQEVKFPYQAVVRDSKDHNLWNQKAVNVKVVITQNGETKWNENFTDLTTNFNGMLTFNVGEGTPANCTNCNLELIEWSDNVVITSTFTDPNDGDRVISVVETPVMAVPYALQAKNAPLTLTTPQIVKYISEVKVNDQQNDVDSILDAIVANPNGLKQYCKDTVYHYFMNHKQEMKDLALYFIRMVDAQDIDEANAAVSSATKEHALELVKDYIKNHPEVAKEILLDYIANTQKEDLKDIFDAVKGNHAFDTVGDFLADTAIKYIKAHPEKVQDVVEYYIKNATTTQVDYLLNKLKANEHQVYAYLVQKFDTHLKNYLDEHHYLTGVCTNPNDTVEFCDIVNRITTLENSVKNNCKFSIDIAAGTSGYNVTLTSTFTAFANAGELAIYLVKEGINDIPVTLTDDDIDFSDGGKIATFTIDPGSFTGIESFNGYSLKVVRTSTANSCTSTETKAF